MINELKLKSKIGVTCRLNVNISNLETALSYLPSLTLLSRGTNLKYKIFDEKIESTIIFNKDKIEIDYTFKEINTAVRRKMLIHLLSIIVFLRELYSINFKSIYPDIIDSLYNIQELNFKKPDSSVYLDRITILNDINLKLYHKNAELILTNNTIQNSLINHKSVCYKIMNSMNYNYDELALYLKSTIKLVNPFFKIFYNEYKDWCKNGH